MGKAKSDSELVVELIEAAEEMIERVNEAYGLLAQSVHMTEPGCRDMVAQAMNALKRYSE